MIQHFFKIAVKDFDFPIQEINFRESIEQMEKPLLELAKKMAVEVIRKEIESGADTDQILIARLRKMLSELVEQNNIIM